MLTLYDTRGQTPGLARREGCDTILGTTVWLDLLNPTEAEDEHVEKALGISIPTRAEMREIEASNRFYQENGAHFMTAFIVYNVDAPIPETSTLTFVLAGNRLVTVRYSEPKAIQLYVARADKGDAQCSSGATILTGLIESIISRQADLVERIQDETERLARSVFEIKGGQQTRSRRLDVLLKTTGKEGDLVSRAQESAFSMDRLLTYFLAVAKERGDDPRLVERLQTAQRDTASLMEHMRFVSNRLTFLLDATLGMINIEQNQIIKLFSVVSVVLMPPTLIASIYGMNFKAMPELSWPLGYPWAIGLMIASAIVPFLYFRRKGWL
ncbi:MAG TPA: magnesium/cobalt transporter CorA [Hyphomicrobiaceae bacterium]|nr:magnesium/cobalt transporter CorA [Hyphomicrobiaceae bacterium]